jgi:hypothetical protein
MIKSLAFCLLSEPWQYRSKTLKGIEKKKMRKIKENQTKFYFKTLFGFL